VPKQHATMDQVAPQETATVPVPAIIEAVGYLLAVHEYFIALTSCDSSIGELFEQPAWRLLRAAGLASDDESEDEFNRNPHRVEAMAVAYETAGAAVEAAPDIAIAIKEATEAAGYRDGTCLRTEGKLRRDAAAVRETGMLDPPEEASPDA
jgi:hypothetical protein